MLSVTKLAGRQTAVRGATARRAIAARYASTWANVEMGPPVSPGDLMIEMTADAFVGCKYRH